MPKTLANQSTTANVSALTASTLTGNLVGNVVAGRVAATSSMSAPLFSGNLAGNVVGAMGAFSTSVSAPLFSGNSLILGTPTSTPTAMLHVEGDIYASGDIVGLSDARKKTQLDRITSALNKLEMLTGYTYCMENSPVRRAGLLAQDCQRALPEAVYVNPDDGTMGVAYAPLTGLLVESIKELATKVSAMADVVDSLSFNV